MNKFLIALVVFGFGFVVAGPQVQADEGMWTLNGFPTQKVEKKYSFNASPEWLRHVQLSSARLAGGCSGSFVSKNGLVMTNHHCAHSCIEQLSKAGKDYVETGFYAKTQKDEVRCPEIEVNRLVDITDVTAQINKATQKLKGKEFNDSLKSTMSQIEKDCSQGQDSVRCDVVTLYHGGKYNLYKYQRYQDVRLVFAPEFATAFFGGDPDNFTFPRYDMDISFLRVYENNKPIESQDYFKWSQKGSQENDLTFVTGHPGRTSRLLTVAELEFIRDISLIQTITYYSELRGVLNEYETKGKEEKRTADTRLFGVENSLKALKGKLEALLDKKLFAQKIADEKKLRQKVDGNATWKREYGSAWKDMADAQEDMKKIYPELNYVENTTFVSRLYGLAKTLVRAADELPKPNGKRFREFADSNLPQLKQGLFSTAPIYNEFEIEMMTFSLTKLRERLTMNNPFVKKLFGQKSPREIAEQVVKGTDLKDINTRKKLFDGGKKAIMDSKDPMIQFALAVDQEARAVREHYENDIEPRLKQASEKVAKAQFAAYGSNTYPDATFTLRISYGQTKGYMDNGEWIKPITTLDGAFARNTGRDPFALPASWTKNVAKLNLNTPLNFCTTNDIIGGNSGSPVINKNAEVVGLIFDGNIQSLGGDYGFDESVNRAVAVHSAGIIELLQNVYGAQRIIDDIKAQ